MYCSNLKVLESPYGIIFRFFRVLVQFLFSIYSCLFGYSDVFTPKNGFSASKNYVEMKDLDKFSPVLNYIGRDGGESSH